MKILLIDNGSTYINKLKALSKAQKTIAWPNLNLKRIKNYDLLILSGGHSIQVKNHRRSFAKEIQIIKTINKPIIGICLGSELIAYTYGAELKLLRKKEHGLVKIQERQGTFKVYESHRWAIKKLPKSLVPIAWSKDGIEIFRHKDKPIFGFQFHPEVLLTKTDGKTLFKSLLKTLALSKD
jgi:GMP synthase (glutamine-hydrolysing)